MPPREGDRHCLSEHHYHRTTSSPSRLGVVPTRPKEGKVGLLPSLPVSSAWKLWVGLRIRSCALTGQLSSRRSWDLEGARRQLPRAVPEDTGDPQSSLRLPSWTCLSCPRASASSGPAAGPPGGRLGAVSRRGQAWGTLLLSK